MSELLIFVKDCYPHGDMTTRSWWRGDVVKVYENGFMEQHCSHQESMVRHHDFWRVLLLPNVPLALAETLEAEEPLGQIVTGRPMNHKRMFTFNLDHPSFSKAMIDYLADDSRAQPWFEESAIGPEEFRPMFTAKRSLIRGFA